MLIIINLFIVLLLVMMNGFFVATEFAMVKVRKSRIDTMVTEGNKSAKYTKIIINDLNTYLSACQLGITLASLGLGWVGEPAVADLLSPLFKLVDLSEVTAHSISIAIAFALITGFHIVLGELVPKSLAIVSSEKIAVYTGLPLLMFYKITFPIMWLFNHSTNLVLKIFGMSNVEEEEAAHTDEEIKILVEESYKHGLIDQTELTFVDNIFDFSEKTVKEIMIPRTDMVCIFNDSTFEDITEIAITEQLTRYPVCKENKDNIVGFIHIKDLFMLNKQSRENNFENIIREIDFVPESTSISKLFKTFQRKKTQMAIVIDEFGGTSGLVTIEDILEEIVGEIQDEFDEEVEEIRSTAEGIYYVDGRVHIEDIGEVLEIEIESEDIDTIGGWVYSQLATYPKINDKIKYEGYEFTILKCDRKRINKLQIAQLKNEEKETVSE